MYVISKSTKTKDFILKVVYNNTKNKGIYCFYDVPDDELTHQFINDFSHVKFKNSESKILYKEWLLPLYKQGFIETAISSKDTGSSSYSDLSTVKITEYGKKFVEGGGFEAEVKKKQDKVIVLIIGVLTTILSFFLGMYSNELKSDQVNNESHKTEETLKGANN